MEQQIAAEAGSFFMLLPVELREKVRSGLEA